MRKKVSGPAVLHCSRVNEKKNIFQFGHDSKLYIKAVAAMKKQPLAPNPTPTTTPEVVKKTVATVETPETANENSLDLSRKKELESEVSYSLRIGLMGSLSSFQKSEFSKLIILRKSMSSLDSLEQTSVRFSIETFNFPGLQRITNDHIVSCLRNSSNSV